METQESQTNQILPLSQAIIKLAPNCVWSLTGDDLSGLDWLDDPKKRPSDKDIINTAKEIYDQLPLKILRKQRDARMKEVDWVTLRSVRTGDPIPQEWKDYMQSLADITKTSTPVLVNGVLMGVEWPERPDGKVSGAPPGFVE